MFILSVYFNFYIKYFKFIYVLHYLKCYNI